MYKIENIINTIICGNTLTELKKFPSESINCVITSPPYWALRDYGLKGQIWDEIPNCEHQWGSAQITLKHKSGETNPGKESWFKDKGASDDKGSNFCSKCSAWRGSLGLEPTFELYLKHLWQIFDEVKRVLKKTGTCWINIGDTYYGGGRNRGSDPDNMSAKQKSNRGTSDFNAAMSFEWSDELPTKSLCQIPSRFSIGMTDRGWILRNEIIWYKRNCMPSSVKDRFTVDFEKIFFFVKEKKYFFEQQYEPHLTQENRPDGIVRDRIYNYNSKQKLLGRTAKGGNGSGELGNSVRFGTMPQGRNRRCVWDITTQPFKGAHFAVFPEALVEPMIKSGCPQFICKKCGKAREKILETNNPSKAFMEEDERTKASIGFGSRQPVKSLHRNKGGVYSSAVYKGYTDCGCNAGWDKGIVLDPLAGSGTTGVEAKELGRNYILIDIKPEYCKMAERGLLNTTGNLF